MNRLASRICLVGLLALAAIPARALDVSVTGLLGYQDGLGLQALGTMGLPNTPIALSLGFGYSFVNPGDPLMARQVFINDNANGTPEKSGGFWTLRMDVIYLVKIGGLEEFGIFAGPRGSFFSGRFKYVGGNEDFTVTSNAFGVGAGVRAGFTLSRHFDIAMMLGFDWFPVETLYGHDTSYSSNGTAVNPTDQYTWTQANEAINQPQFVPSLLLGVSWRL
jgi:hypothetical protein